MPYSERKECLVSHLASKMQPQLVEGAA